MAKILDRALRNLGGLFGIVGSQVSTDQVDLTSVQLVSNVNQLAGYGLGPGLHFGRALYQVHQDFTVSAEITETIDAYDPALPLGGWRVPSTHDLWVMRCFVTVENTGITALDWSQIMLDYPVGFVGAEDSASAAVAIEDVIFGGNDTLSTSTLLQPSNIIDVFPIQSPVWIPRGTSIVFNSRTGSAGNLNLTLNVLVLAIPKGLYPTT